MKEKNVILTSSGSSTIHTIQALKIGKMMKFYSDFDYNASAIQFYCVIQRSPSRHRRESNETDVKKLDKYLDKISIIKKLFYK